MILGKLLPLFLAFMLISSALALTVVYNIPCTVKVIAPTAPPIDWEGITERAEQRKEMYNFYYRMVFNQTWWREMAIGKADAVADLWNPLSWAAKKLFTELLPKPYGELLIFYDAYKMAEALINFRDAILYDQVYMTVWASHQGTSWILRDNLKSLIEKLDLIVLAAKTRDFSALTTGLEDERDLTKTLYQNSVSFDNEAEYYSKMAGYDPLMVYYVLREHVVAFRLSLEANYLDITDTLGQRRGLSEDVNAPLVARNSPPLVVEGYWEVNGEKVTTAKVGEEVKAHIVIKPRYGATYDPMKVSGKVTLQVWKDRRLWPDEECARQTFDVDVKLGETFDMALYFKLDEASNPRRWWPGTLEGYYLKTAYTGWVFVVYVEGQRVMWEDGGYEMKDSYPPRLWVEGNVMNIAAESPINLLVTDPDGRRVGFDVVSQQIVNEIPGSMYTGPGSEPQIITITNPLVGNYMVDAYGIDRRSYTVTLESLASDGSVISSKSLTGTAVSGGYYTYTFQMSSDGSLTIPPIPPVAMFMENLDTVDIGETISFDASESYDPDGTIVSYEWDFGDGTTATGVTATHAYTAEGTYTVILTVTDNDGLTDTTRAIKTVLAPTLPPEIPEFVFSTTLIISIGTVLYLLFRRQLSKTKTHLASLTVQKFRKKSSRHIKQFALKA